MEQELIFTNDVVNALDCIYNDIEPHKIFVLTDETTAKVVLPQVSESKAIKNACKITIPEGDSNKNIGSLQSVWSALHDGNATRKSVLINIGGGVVTDLGGFAAATFKRGMRFINIPTTLLGAVDAAVGGKTGINYKDYKNEIGAFREAEKVIVSTRFFDTLPIEEVKSGYAEMLKHALISGNNAFIKAIAYDLSNPDMSALLPLLEESVKIKSEIVRQDPEECGLRKTLNLGHTAGHAFESLAMHRGKPIPHGYAVAYGLVTEAVVSVITDNLASDILYKLSDFVSKYYGAFRFTCDDYDSLLEYMRHDKKSISGEYNFSLLKSPGNILLNYAAKENDIKTAFDIYRDLNHI